MVWLFSPSKYKPDEVTSELQQTFHNNKLKFYHQQSYDGNVKLKKYICCVAAAMVAYELLQTMVLLPKEVYYAKTSTTNISTALYVVTLICYYISMFLLGGKNTTKAFLIRRVLFFVSALAFGTTLGLKAYDELTDRVEENTVLKWTYSLLRGRNEVWIILIVDLLMPTWYIKIICPLFWWIGQVIAYSNEDIQSDYIIWSCFICSILITSILWGLKDYNDWKIFLKRANVEAWDDVHRYILDKVPDAIAVINPDLKVIYSNVNFKAICNDSLQDLSQRLIKIKKADANFETNSYGEEAQRDETHNASSQEEQKIGFTFPQIVEKIMLPMLSGGLNEEQYSTFHAKMTQPNVETVRSYEIKIGPLLEYKKVILILTDTTQRDRAISLDAANQYKDKLLAAVSHDLRAPINGSISLIEGSLEHEEVPASIKQQFLVPALRSCRFLLHLANDILDFSQINAQKLRMNFETCSIVETIRNCFQLLEMQASYKKINFELVLDETLPDKFTTDHNRASQIIINLLTNAIKFTFTGKVVLSARRVAEEIVGVSLIEISVGDTGIGIKDNDKPKLFREFTRIEYDQKDINTRGVGLGLVIANKLARVLGPNTKREGISMSSIYGQGSTFTFALEDKGVDSPKEERFERTSSLQKGVNSCLLNLSEREEDFLFRKIEEGDTSNARSVHNSPYQSGFSTRRHLLQSLQDNSILLQSIGHITCKQKQFSGKVLVVDDNPVNILALEAVLKKYGIRIDAAYNGKEAIEKVLQNEKSSKGTKPRTKGRARRSLFGEEGSEGYELIFMDYEMPVMDGFEATRKLRTLMQNTQINTIPIIGCTGHQETQMIQECRLNGMTDVVGKPPEKEKLVEILEKYMA